MDTSRILSLAGITEAHYDDQQQAAADEAMMAERRVEQYIRQKFASLKLTIAHHMSAVIYDPTTREAEVTLEESFSGYSVEALASLGVEFGDLHVRADHESRVQLTFIVTTAW